MHSSRHRTQPRLAPSLPDSLRASAKVITGSSSNTLTAFAGYHRRPARPTRALPPLPEETFSRPGSWLSEFEHISYDEFRRTLLLADSTYAFPVTDYQSQPSVLARSREKIRKFSRVSLKKARPETSPKAAPFSSFKEQPVPALASPLPPTSPASCRRASVDTAPVEDTSSAFYDQDPFRKVESTVELPELAVSSREVGKRSALASTSSLVPDCSHNRDLPESKPLKRLKSLSKLNLFGSRKQAHQVQPELPPSRPIVAEVVTDYLPELDFNQVDFSTLFEQDESSPSLPPVPPKEPKSPFQSVRQLEPELSEYISHLQVFRYERVDPRDLTTSARTSTVIGYSPTTASPLPPPSPSWLSRNVKDLDFYADPQTPLPIPPPSPRAIPIPPPSPRPLPILPRSLLPVPSRTSLADSQSCADCLDVPESPRSTSSSVTLFVCSQPPSPVRTSFCTRSRPPSTATNRLSVVNYRKSLTDSGNAHLILAYNQLVPGSAVSKRSSLNVLFVSEPSPGPQEPPPPLLAFDSDRAVCSYPEHTPARLSRTLPAGTLAPKPPKPSLRIFIPSDPGSPHFVPNNLSDHILAAIRDPSILSAMSAAYGKPSETVDWGEDYDYSGYEWFKDPPPRPEPPPPPRIHEMPDQAAMQQNAMFDFALKSAPNVLYARFKQYGQLGVLAWSSEFSEMIDALKELGFQGNMFVATRTQALRTCEEIIKLLKTNLKIDMQIIIMYLCSQVARLRRFLDGDRQWNDYPELNFPIDPYKHGAE